MSNYYNNYTTQKYISFKNASGSAYCNCIVFAHGNGNVGVRVAMISEATIANIINNGTSLTISYSDGVYLMTKDTNVLGNLFIILSRQKLIINFYN